jgi:hypothetical protein
MVEAHPIGQSVVIQWLSRCLTVDVFLRILPSDARHIARVDVYGDGGELVEQYTEAERSTQAGTVSCGFLSITAKVDLPT